MREAPRMELAIAFDAAGQRFLEVWLTDERERQTRLMVSVIVCEGETDAEAVAKAVAELADPDIILDPDEEANTRAGVAWLARLFNLAV